MKKLTLIITFTISLLLLVNNSYAKNKSLKPSKENTIKLKKRFPKDTCFCYKKESMELLAKAIEVQDERATQWFFDKKLCACFGNSPEFSYLDEIKDEDSIRQIVPVIVYDGTPQVLYFFLKDLLEGFYL